MFDAITSLPSALVKPQASRLSRFLDRFYTRKTAPAVTYLNHLFAEYIRKNAVPLEVNGEQCLVVTPGMLEKLEEGEI